MFHGNIYRILNGYDNCGNICGRINVFAEVDNSGCHGMDMTTHKYLRVQSWGVDAIESDYVQVNRICVENCSNYSGLLVSKKKKINTFNATPFHSHDSYCYLFIVKLF